MPASTPSRTPSHRHRLLLALLLTGASLAPLQPVAAQAAACDGSSDRTACQREARNARAEGRRGGLTTPVDPQANALARCAALDGEDRSACEARMMGYGQQSGSVAAGGLLREAETVVMPPGATEITVQPRGGRPVVVLPSPER